MEGRSEKGGTHYALGDLETFKRQQYARRRLHVLSVQWIAHYRQSHLQANGRRNRLRGHVAKQERDHGPRLFAAGSAVRGRRAFLQIFVEWSNPECEIRWRRLCDGSYD